MLLRVCETKNLVNLHSDLWGARWRRWVVVGSGGGKGSFAYSLSSSRASRLIFSKS